MRLGIRVDGDQVDVIDAETGAQVEDVVDASITRTAEGAVIATASWVVVGKPRPYVAAREDDDRPPKRQPL